MKLEFSQHTFEKYSNIIFNENPSSGSRVLSLRMDSWKDRQTYDKSLFCISANMPKKLEMLEPYQTKN